MHAISNTRTDSRQSSTRTPLWVGLLYIGIFALFFWGIHGGVGQFWDWSFPYFSDHLQMLFNGKSTSWTPANQGSPLGYSSDYFVRFFVGLFGLLQLPPELVRYGLMVPIFAAGAFGTYLIAKRHTTTVTAFFIGLVTLINPAIFYKYTAGHFNYLLAFTLFIFMLYFLLYKFDKNLRSAVVVGLFFAFMGAQIQFFIIGAFFLATYFIFNRQQLALRYALVILALPLLINLVWLSNFITGAASAADIGAAAAKVSFKSLSGSDFLSIFTFSFAKATLLTKFYALYELLWNAALFLLLLWLLIREKQKHLVDVMLLTFLALMIFMATGLFQMVRLGPISMLYPMLREVGHFAPIIVLTMLLLMARLVQNSRWRWALTTILAGSLLIVGVKFQFFSQSYSFADVRSQFAPFKAFADKDKSNYRILAYPFFDQYSFNKLPPAPKDTMPLSNSGHDSFAAFSKQQYIANTIAPHKFQDSVQYQLLQTYNVDVLRPYNVKYLFDFSGIYESNYERYVPPTVYNNDLALIKNDKQFFEKLLAANPGKLKRVSNTILEVTDFKPKVAAEGTLFALNNQDEVTSSVGFTADALDTALDYVTVADAKEAGIAPYVTNVTTLFADGNRTDSNETNTRASQTIKQSKTTPSKLYINREHDTVFYRLAGKTLTIFTQSAGSLTLNDQPLYSTGNGERIIEQVAIQPGVQYYAAFKGKTIALQAGSSGRLGLGEKDDRIDIFTATEGNLVSNTSFENGLWQDKVQDCNNYDFEKGAQIAMRQAQGTASTGNASLELEAERHDACTHTSFTIEARSSYLLSFDYQSPNAKTMSYYMAYEGANQSFARASKTIRDTSWESYSSLIETPEQSGSARLYLYALEQQDQKTINRYDNVSLVQLNKIQSLTIPGATQPYEVLELPQTDEQTFTITDNSQTYRNLLANPSFEQGSWQRKVSDCRKYDANGDINMRLNTEHKTHGKQSLELSATRHDACVRTTTDISSDTDYQLTFDFRGEKGKNYAYAFSFDDPLNTIRRQQETITATGKWQTATVRLKAPVRSSTITIYLYAPEAPDKTPNVIQYDNVQLSELPDYVDRFFVVHDPQTSLKAPTDSTFTDSRTGAKRLSVKSASTPFFVTISETYHPKWRLQLANSSVTGPVNSWLPTAAATAVSTHFMTNNYSNSWLVDPAALCKDNPAGCQRNEDGSYNLELAAEFTPQRWFGIHALISWLTIVACGLYLVIGRHPVHAPRFIMRRRQ